MNEEEVATSPSLDAAAADAEPVKPQTEEALQAFVMAVVEGRCSVAHSVDPDDISAPVKRLGVGASGTVFKAIFNEKYVAVKRFSESNISYDEQEIRAEAALMSVLAHPNLVTYLGACLQPGNMLIITELYPTNLQSLVEDQSTEIPMPILLRIGLGVANGMRFLHSLGLIHRDLKCGNVLLTADFDAKITDFGTTRVVPKNKQVLMTGGIGTTEFMAPEVMQHESYTKKADVFGFAIMMWQMITREVPYSNMNRFTIPEFVIKGGRPNLPQNAHPKVLALIKACWNQKPERRPDFDDIFRLLQVIAGLIPGAFDATTDYFRVCGEHSIPGLDTERLVDLQTGSVLLKCGRSGSPHFALFQVSDDVRYLQWTSKKKSAVNAKIDLSTVTEIIIGQKTPVFARNSMSMYTNISFSLVCPDRTVDIVCANVHEFKLWTKGLKSIVEHFRPAPVETKPTPSPTPLAPSPKLEEAPESVEERPTTPRKSEEGSPDKKKELDRYSGSSRFLIRRSLAAGGLEQMTFGGMPIFLPDFDASSVVRREVNQNTYVWPIGKANDESADVFLLEELLGKGIVTIACGETHYAALTNIGELYMWGNNDHGQLAYSYNTTLVPQKPSFSDIDPNEPVLKTPHIVPFAGAKIVSVACGKHHTLCCTLDGVVFAWGKNTHGELGVGDVMSRSMPTPVKGLSGKKVVFVAAGPHTSACVTSDNEVFMWGLNDNCQLGIGHNRPVTTPQLLEDIFMTKKKAGLHLTVSKKHLLAVGGANVRDTRFSEVDAEDDGKIASDPVDMIALGRDHSAAMTSSGTVWMWGRMGDQMMPKPTKTPFNTDEEGGLGGIAVQIASGYSHLLVLTNDNQVYSWGDGRLGQLGHSQGELVDQPQLMDTSLLSGVPAIVSASRSYSVIATTTGEVFACGYGSRGLNDVRRECCADRLVAFKTKKVASVVCAPSALIALVTQRKAPDSRLVGWIPDNEIQSCMNCKQEFNQLRRRHHCRKCEGIFCSKCSKWKSPLLSKGFAEPVRVCQQCFNMLKSANMRTSASFMTPTKPTAK